MDFSYATAEAFARSHGYFLIFLVMVLEGPTITTAAAFAASLGYFDIGIIFLLSIAGDLVGDAIHFWIGVGAGKPVIERYGKRVGLDRATLDALERKLESNLAKTLFVMKMTPVAGIGILLAGSLKVPARKFFPMALLITIPRAAAFTILGFSFGWAVERALGYFALGEYAILAILVFGAIVYYFYRRTGKRLRRGLTDATNAFSTSGRRRAKIRRS